MWPEEDKVRTYSKGNTARLKAEWLRLRGSKKASPPRLVYKDMRSRTGREREQDFLDSVIG
jgi:hypothetical protein